MTPARPRRPAVAEHVGHVIEPMLSIDDLASVLSVSRRMIERERAAGRLPRPDLLIGRCPRWLPESVRGWIAKGGRS
ncbi:helix-turn-helix transcriptional regulator [Aquisphaera insulae]|uniref:helix-turn-helix transcriptional regulator n=1 Tax=Aquisphaera insulae TaxID=2712864 RepID=UPI0013E9B14B|nr:hypothetical protein [Aquisphaera insulae]